MLWHLAALHVAVVGGEIQKCPYGEEQLSTEVN